MLLKNRKPVAPTTASSEQSHDSSKKWRIIYSSKRKDVVHNKCTARKVLSLIRLVCCQDLTDLKSTKSCSKDWKPVQNELD